MPGRKYSDEMLARMNAEYAAQQGGRVPVPTSPDQAALMVLLGMAYLKRFAPERLRNADTSAVVTSE